MPSGWHKGCNKNSCSRKFRRGNSSRKQHSSKSWPYGINGYGLVGGGASSRRRVGNTRQKNPGCRCPCHPAIKSARVIRIEKAKVKPLRLKDIRRFNQNYGFNNSKHIFLPPERILSIYLRSGMKQTTFANRLYLINKYVN